MSVSPRCKNGMSSPSTMTLWRNYVRLNQKHAVGKIGMEHHIIRNFSRSTAGAMVLVLSVASACAQDVEEFYNKRTMTLIVSSDVGGGFDTYSRTLARHITRHIPGMPKIVVQNMPGAGSLTALNYLSNIASR